MQTEQDSRSKSELDPVTLSKVLNSLKDKP
jgi:hypothetical protein